MLINCVVILFVILQIATKYIQRNSKNYTNYKRCNVNPCKFWHTVIKNYEKFEELSKKVNKIEDNLNYESNIEQKIKTIDEKLRVLERLEIWLWIKKKQLKTIIQLKICLNLERTNLEHLKTISWTWKELYQFKDI